MDQTTLVNRIMSRLGHPQVRVEVSEEDINGFVEEAMEKINPYLSESFFIQKPAESSINLKKEGVIGVVRVYATQSFQTSEADLLGIASEYTLITSGAISNRVVSQAEMNNLDALVERGFKFVDGILYLDDFSGEVVIECLKRMRYDDLIGEREKSWVQRYATALAKEKVGRIRSKVRIPNLPIELDGDALISEGTAEQEACRSELSAENYGFFFVTR